MVRLFKIQNAVFFYVVCLFMRYSGRDIKTFMPTKMWNNCSYTSYEV